MEEQHRIYGLLGKDISYSFSPAYFKAKFEREGISNVDYLMFDEVDPFVFMAKANKMKGLEGFNITIPYKQSLIPIFDSISFEASEMLAVNCVKRNGSKWEGYNTDVYGFEYSLAPLLAAHHSKAVVLGTGGASRAVTFVLQKLGIAFLTVSRSKNKADLTYEQLSPAMIQNFPIIINTTPLGTHPNIDQKPAIPYEALNESHLLYDLVYNPAESAFLTAGKNQGAAIKNGLQMLELQAEKSWEIWNSVT
ncbi:MAG: shikimate dehydrogenase [Saprospiraceae bacterium]|nr:shikimate dehydrogenase [Saprospiraceae bacterium]